MPYDANLDDCLFTKCYENERERVTVSVYSYNKGAKKLQITRENKDKNDEFRFTRLGRISKEEILAILPLIQEALKEMD
jgi:hypothetical protein